jgi:hypothetical protein
MSPGRYIFVVQTEAFSDPAAAQPSIEAENQYGRSPAVWRIACRLLHCGFSISLVVRAAHDS